MSSARLGSSQRLDPGFSGEYRLTRRIAAFANLRNIGAAPEEREIAGPNPTPHAHFRPRLDFDSLWTFGLKG